MLELEAAPKVPPEVIAFYQAIGFDAGQIETLKTRGFGNFRKAVSPIPRAFHRIVEGRPIRIGDHDWQVIVGSGHSPDNACLYAPELHLLISGEQVMTRTAPHKIGRAAWRERGCQYV